MTDHEGLRKAMGVRDPSGPDEIQQMLDDGKRAVVEAEDEVRIAGFRGILVGVLIGWLTLGAVFYFCS
jgi:hypothetical protein